MLAIRATAISILAFLAGCADLRYYPVCVVDTPEVLPELIWLRAKDQVVAALRSGVPSMSVLPSPSSYGVLVNTTRASHDQLSKVWPNIACVVSMGDPIQDDVLLRQCQQDMSAYFSGNWGVWPGPVADISSRCVRIELSIPTLRNGPH